MTKYVRNKMNLVNQWYLKVMLKENKKSVYFQCGDDEDICREKEKQAIEKFGNTIETEVFFGNLVDRQI
jgi:hypothetical protein